MAGHKCDDDKTTACEGIQYNTIAQDNVYTTRHKDTEWIVLMKTNKGGIPAPDTSSSVVDPTASGYQYMKHSVFAKFAASSSKVLVRAWNINAPEWYMECTLDSAGTNYKDWTAMTDCLQRVVLRSTGESVSIPLPNPDRGNHGKGFQYGGSVGRNTINPENGVTGHSVFTKVNTNSLSSGWAFVETEAECLAKMTKGTSTSMSCSNTFTNAKWCTSGESDTVLAEAGTTWETCAALCSSHGSSLGDTSACCNYRDGNGDTQHGRCIYFSGGTLTTGFNKYHQASACLSTFVETMPGRQSSCSISNYQDSTYANYYGGWTDDPTKALIYAMQPQTVPAAIGTIAFEPFVVPFSVFLFVCCICYGSFLCIKHCRKIAEQKLCQRRGGDGSNSNSINVEVATLTTSISFKPLPEGCKYHFFICKHEKYGANGAMNIYYELERRGYKVWISNGVEGPNLTTMQEAVRSSVCILLFLTHGIFTRPWCMHLELYEAMLLRKPVCLVRSTKGDHKYQLDAKEMSSATSMEWFGLGSTVHPRVEPVVQRLLAALEVIDWSLVSSWC